MFSITLLAIAAAFANALPIILPRQAGGRLIVFGDSFSDNGNGSWLVSNKTWPADPAYYNHMFSNGPVWADQLASTLGIDLIDYGTGGATADNSFVAGFTGYNSTIPVPSAFDQVQHFLNTSTPREGDIFVHYIGANDPTFNTSITGAQVTSLINRDVDLLYRAGVKTLLLADYPPVSLFPALYGNTEYAFGPSYEDSLAQGLRNIASGYSAYMNVSVVDVQGLFADIFANPGNYGIDSSYVNPPTACLKGAYPGEGPRTLCSDPEKHLFFDTYHPVTQVHTRVAKLFQAALDNFR